MMGRIADWYLLMDGGTNSNCTVGGSASAITLTCSPTVNARSAGQRYVFKLGSAITGATTLAVDGLTSGAVQWNQTAIVANDFAANDWVYVVDDGTNYQLVTPPKLSTYAQINNLTADGTGATGDFWVTYDVSASGPKKVLFSTYQTLMNASQAQQETGTATTVWVSPGRQHFHASAAKAWASFVPRGTNGAATIAASYNVSGVSRTAAGVYTITYSTAQSGTAYVCGGTSEDSSANNLLVVCTAKATTTFTIKQMSASTAGGSDLGDHIDVWVFGDL